MIIKHLPENVGFGPANNLGVLSSKADVVILMSNDVVVQGDFVENLLAAVSVNEKTVCSPRIVDWPAGWNEFPPEPPIPYAEGWLLAMKRSTWGKIGGFDRRYAPCDYEDVDFSFTAVKKGFNLKQVNVPVQHIGAGTLGYTQERRTITDNHRRLFAEKWGLIWTPVK
jgi:GT2 family glycosyltransferase